VSYKKGDRVLCLETGRIYEVFSAHGAYVLVGSEPTMLPPVLPLWVDLIVPTTPLIEELS